MTRTDMNSDMTINWDNLISLSKINKANMKSVLNMNQSDEVSFDSESAISLKYE